MPQPNKSRKPDKAVCDTILLGLLPMAEAFWENDKFLRAASFDWHVPRLNYDLALEEEERTAEWRTYLAEEAKERICNEVRHPIFCYGGDTYQSPELEARRPVRDQAFGRKLTSEVWRELNGTERASTDIPIDPVMKAERMLSANDRAKLDLLAQTRRSEQARLQKQVTATATASRGLPPERSREDRMQFVTQRLLNCLGSEGFYADRKRKPLYPLVSRDLSRDWKISLLINGRNIHEPLPTEPTPGIFVISCHLRDTKSTVTMRDFPDPFNPEAPLPLRYEDAAPYFATSYCMFEDDAQLEYVCEAHCLLLRREMPTIIKAVESAL